LKTDYLRLPPTPLAACPFVKLPENAVTAKHLTVTNGKHATRMASWSVAGALETITGP